MSAGSNVHFAMICFSLIATYFIAWLGIAWFQKTRKGFADVL